MDTPTRLQENISAMVDDELPPCDAELTLAALAGLEGRTAWHLYHLIGDTLRASTPSGALSEGFADRLAARLAAEATPVRDGAPAPQGPRDDNAASAAAVTP
ncbi:sigma-E factor negative regulatory protein RseA [Pseudoduganella lurida]|uniref:Sigma-E factor negative regulatory protein RseA n=1 Tax=Pseudoduganella lurida TaxID=1036180 RepID=A0A562R0B1_9BURK|nr:sigma-E factor negative regulatory protein [Pseudoduganella lurida]TWI62505.1 sigma-E factor negative regulatory protein RseA [Pseudoduganella lurida]